MDSKTALWVSVYCSLRWFPDFTVVYMWNCSSVFNFLLFRWISKIDIHSSMGGGGVVVPVDVLRIVILCIYYGNLFHVL